MTPFRFFPKSTKVRVVTQGVHFFASVWEIRNGVGDDYTTNASIQKALCTLERMKESKGVEGAASGLAGIWEGRNVQIDILK